MLTFVLMEVTKKYTAIKLGSKTINDDIEPTFSFGGITGPHYDRQYPEEEFDSEEEAIRYAYNTDEYARWMIVPIVKFI
jgi:hypothetical protein